jgi:hypothetical protein
VLTTTFHAPGHARHVRVERPAAVWIVYKVVPGEPPEPVGFYDRQRAVAWAAASEHRHLKPKPLQVKDAVT